MPQRSKIGGILFLSCLSFCHSLWNFNLANNFWTVSARSRALIFHMNIPCDKTFWWVPFFYPFFENFNFAYNFWTVSARALIFHMNILCDKTFPWVPLCLALWPWPWSLTNFLAHLAIGSSELFWPKFVRCQSLSLLLACCWCCFIVSSSYSEPLSQFQPNLAQSIRGWRRFKFDQMKDPTLSKGR